MDKYEIYVPEKVTTTDFSIDELSKKDIEDTIKTSLEEKVYVNKQYTYFIKDETLYLTSFKDILPDTKKGVKALVPIHSIFKSFTKDDSKVLSIIVSLKYGVVAQFIGNELITYEPGFDNEKDLVQHVMLKLKKANTSYAGKKKIKVLTDSDFDSITSNDISLETIDINTLEKSEVLHYKSKLEMILEQVNIKVKFNLNLKEFVKIIIQSSLFIAIFYVVFVVYNQQKDFEKQQSQLDGFYKEMKDETLSSMKNYNEKLLKDSDKSIIPLQSSIESLEKKIGKVEDSNKSIEALKNSVTLISKTIKNETPTIQQVNNLNKRLDSVVKLLIDMKKNGLSTNIDISSLKNLKKLNSKSSKNKVDDIKTSTTTNIKYEVLIKTDSYLKIRLGKEIFSLTIDESSIFDNKEISYKENKLIVDGNAYHLRNSGTIKF